MADRTSFQQQRQNEARPRAIINQHVWKTYGNGRFSQEWRNLPEIPSTAEICPPSKTLADVSDTNDAQDKNPVSYQTDPLYEKDLPHNIIDGPWPSKEAYIGAHYQILREDAIAPLRRAVDVFKNCPTLADDPEICVYKDLTIMGLKLSRLGVGFRVAFSPQKQIRWKQSKRLLQGTMVALSKDLFKTDCKIAIVVGRGQKALAENPPSIELFWANRDDAVIDPVTKYVMIESREGYFEASRHVLVAMQKLMTEKFELQNHIVHLDKDVKAPRYVEDQPLMDLSSLEQNESASSPKVADPDRYINVDVLRDFPEDMQSSMDKSQISACQRMLTSRIAIIQGPPGTGKTYTSISTLKVMIQNWRPGDPPVIISAQTNHALDQLLNQVLAFEPSIVRLGGRSNKANEEILKRTLYNLKHANSIPGGNSGFRQVNLQFDKCKRDITDALETLMTENLLNGEMLMKNGLITESQYKSLYASSSWEGVDSSSDIAHWLGDGQIMPVPETAPVNPGLEWEQGDIEEEEVEDIDDEFKTDAAVGQKKDDDEDRGLDGDPLPFKRKFTGRHSNPPALPKIRHRLASCKNLYDIPRAYRGEVYRYLEIAMNKVVLKELKGRLNEYQEVVNAWTSTKHMSSVRLIRHLGIKVIGCTTTGLSKYRALLSAVEPRVLLIEEAAETLEGNVIGGLMDSIQHLILVGDHQQLQANCTVRALELKPYYMNISMFERLVNNSIGYVMLNVQRRMIQDVRKLLSRAPNPFYEDLRDHPSVLDRIQNRPPVPGMGGLDTYFFHHTWPDAKTAESSRYNLGEAQFIARFYLYLCQNGVDPGKITVLTFYNGQKAALTSELKLIEALGQFRPKVFTVDSYQGEENDVILLSLVRGNNSNSIGFLDSKNRLVVAISRARQGLYIFGNAVTLTVGETTENYVGREPLWSPLVAYMIAQCRFNLDRGLPVFCKKHGKTTLLYEHCHFDKVLNGGCDILCGGKLFCGHPCEAHCHPLGHEFIECKAACPLTLTCGHKCSRKCSTKCYCDGCGLYDGQFRVPEYSTEASYLSAWEKSPTEASVSSPPPDYLTKKHVSFASTLMSTDVRNTLSNGHSAQMLTLRPAARQLFHISERRSSPESGATGLSTPYRPHSGRPRGSTYSSQTSIVRGIALSSSNLSPVSPDTWKNWDAKKADEDLAEQHRREEAVAPKVNRSQLTFNEKYIPTSLNSRGERIVSRSQRRTIGRSVLEYAALDTVVRYGANGDALRSMESDARHHRITSPTELQSNKAKARAASKALVDVTKDMSNLPKKASLLPAFGDEPEGFVGSKFVEEHLQNKLDDASSPKTSNEWCAEDWPVISPSKEFAALQGRPSRGGINLTRLESARGSPRGRGSFGGADSFRGANFADANGTVRGSTMRRREMSRESLGARGHFNGRVQPVQELEQPIGGDHLGLDNSPVIGTPSPVTGDILDLYTASPPRYRVQRNTSAFPKTPEQNSARTMPPRTPENNEVFEERSINFD